MMSVGRASVAAMSAPTSVLPVPVELASSAASWVSSAFIRRAAWTFCTSYNGLTWRDKLKLFEARTLNRKIDLNQRYKDGIVILALVLIYDNGLHQGERIFCR